MRTALLAMLPLLPSGTYRMTLSTSRKSNAHEAVFVPRTVVNMTLFSEEDILRFPVEGGVVLEGVVVQSIADAHRAMPG